LLLSFIIPISLRVNLDIAKGFYCFWMFNDSEHMERNIPRSSTIPEELGRIGFLLSDKTGTLTSNEMVFKKLAMENYVYMASTSDAEDSLSILKYKLLSSCKKHPGTGPKPD